ncbi:MAG: thioredoxin family protein [Muribaculaceae bacterium]|nr:thioredoxin family protein [Muribaculaceae bacterium]
MRRTTILMTLLLAVIMATAQIVTPVKWKTAIKVDDKTRTALVTMTATIDDGWHLYSTDLPSGGPVATSVDWKTLEGVELVGGLKPSVTAHVQHDPNFDMDLKWWTGTVSLTQKVKITAEKYAMKGSIRYMSCNDKTCSAPTTEPMTFSGTIKVEEAKEEEKSAEEKQEETSDTISATVAEPETITPTGSAVGGDLWAPVNVDNGVAAGSDAGSLWMVFWACFGGGLLALLTPCVWPIIPMTVSFFMKKSGSRSKAIRDAVIYGLSIIVIYVALGLIVTALFGPSTLNAIATNAICNIVFFLLLVVFAISFFGAFDLHLPGSWSTKLDKASHGTSGLLSIFFMAFTLAIVSFSCTGPIIGTLLVEAAGQGNRLAPAIGMLGFSIALAIPFSLFALFPSALKKMPKGGGWLNTVKVVLGFLELALALKFLSVADLAYGWHILDREVFLSLWIAIFGLLGFYLLGMFRLKSDGEAKTSRVGVTRLLLGIISLAFTAYLVPGLWGAPLRATSAFVPPMSTQDFNLAGDERRVFDDYEQGMAAARASGKPVLIDFSGYGCVNCRKMEGAVLDRYEVKSFINDNFITITLMVDDKAELPQPIEVEENGKVVTLETVGDKWSYLQRHKFGSNSQPYYVVLDHEGQLLSGPAVYDESVSRYMKFLKQGLKQQ